MVYSHWELRESPYAAGIDPRAFYQSTNHEEALARLHFLADQPRRTGLLLGGSGVGKTLLLEVFARQIRSSTRQVVTLSLLGITTADFLWQLAVKLGRDLQPTESVFRLWSAVADQLRENRYQRISTVLLLDDADEAHSEVLMQVARVTQADLAPDARLTMVLAAQPQRLANLGSRLLELSDLRIDLEPWSEPETMAYLRWALVQAGRAKATFTPEAMRHIHRLAAGAPRRVKQLADMALLAGAGSDLELVNDEVVEGVFQELGVGGTRNSELGTRNSELGTRNSERGTRNAERETGKREPESRDVVLHDQIAERSL